MRAGENCEGPETWAQIVSTLVPSCSWKGVRGKGPRNTPVATASRSPNSERPWGLGCGEVSSHPGGLGQTYSLLEREAGGHHNHLDSLSPESRHSVAEGGVELGSCHHMPSGQDPGTGQTGAPGPGARRAAVHISWHTLPFSFMSNVAKPWPQLSCLLTVATATVSVATLPH